MNQTNPGRLDPTGRAIMLSGANRVIGAAIAQRLCDDGYHLSLAARRPGGIVEAQGDDCIHYPFDALDLESPRTWAEATVAKFGRIDGLINNAGIAASFGLKDGDKADLDRMLEVNLKAPYRWIRAALPLLRASGSSRFVNITSLAGMRFQRGSPGYAKSKFAAMGLSSAARTLIWEDGFQVTAVASGPVSTDMMPLASGMQWEEATQPETIADVVAIPINAMFELLP